MSTNTMGNQLSLQSLAKEFDISENTVQSVLDALGIVYDDSAVLAEGDELTILREELEKVRGTKQVTLKKGATPKDVADALGVKLPEVQKTLMMKLKTVTQPTAPLKEELAENLVKALGYSLVWAAEKPKPVAAPKPQKAGKAASEPVTRPPVVTIMGHVDHGKTSLLDYIRKANVAAKEHGGITQHIGAYQVKTGDSLITFLDTPGHAAFTAMRARGAQVTDIAILVVAADDGIMPQTIEAIGHIQAAKVPMIVAVNKIDKPGANPDKVLSQLTEHGVVPEQFGGQTITANVSAITGEGVPNLLELIALQAEIMELKADPKGEFRGVVVEAKLDKGRGPVATVLVKEGTLKIGHMVIVGNTFGKIKAMTDYQNERINVAGPSVPVEILGLNEVPGAGDFVEVAAGEREAREIATDRANTARAKSLEAPKRSISLRDLKRQIENDGQKTLNLLIKADVQGSVEAVKGLLEKVANDEVEVKIIYAAVGAITESDVLLASAADGIIVGFNARPEGKAKVEAERAKVEIRTYTIIYELVEDIEAAIKGMLEPKFEEQALGRVEIRMAFKLTKQGHVAGCHVVEGSVKRGCQCRVIRDREVVYEGKIDSLKNVKQDVREMNAGQDCGIQFDDWTGFKVGDVIEAFEMVRVMD